MRETKLLYVNERVILIFLESVINQLTQSSRMDDVVNKVLPIGVLA